MLIGGKGWAGAADYGNEAYGDWEQAGTQRRAEEKTIAAPIGNQGPKDPVHEGTGNEI